VCDSSSWFSVPAAPFGTKYCQCMATRNPPRNTVTKYSNVRRLDYSDLQIFALKTTKNIWDLRLWSAWVMGYRGDMGYGADSPAYEHGILKNVWGIREYGFIERWVMREATVESSFQSQPSVRPSNLLLWCYQSSGSPSSSVGSYSSVW
jgi:hypothetical protein